MRCELFYPIRLLQKLSFWNSKKGEEQLDQSKAVVNIGMTIAQGSHPQSLERNVNYDWKGYAAKHIIYPRDQGRGAQGQRLLSSHSGKFLAQRSTIRASIHIKIEWVEIPFKPSHE